MLRSKEHGCDGVAPRDFVALVDDALPAERQAEVERAVAASPTLSATLTLHRRTTAALRTFDAPTPDSLTIAIGTPRVTRRAAPTRAWIRPLGATALAAVTLIVAIGLWRPGDDSSGAVAAAAELSALPAREAAPATIPGSKLLRRSFVHVTFPAWTSRFGWRATGARHDRIDGRTTDTVFYQHTHHRIGYTVLSGAPVQVPTRGQTIRRNGLRIQLYRDGDRTVAVFERSGHTCVLAGVVHYPETLVKLAASEGSATAIR